MAVAAPEVALSNSPSIVCEIANIFTWYYAPIVNKKITTEGTMSRTILTATLAALWLIALDGVPSVPSSKVPILSGSAQAATKLNSSRSNVYRGTTVKSSKSNTSDRKRSNKKPGNPPTSLPGGGGY
jgi:hypothetical protein